MKISFIINNIINDVGHLICFHWLFFDRWAFQVDQSSRSSFLCSDLHQKVQNPRPWSWFIRACLPASGSKEKKPSVQLLKQRKKKVTKKRASDESHCLVAINYHWGYRPKTCQKVDYITKFLLMIEVLKKQCEQKTVRNILNLSVLIRSNRNYQRE